MEQYKIGDKGKYLSIGTWLECEIIEIKNPLRKDGPDLKIKITPAGEHRCRSITTIKSANFKLAQN